MTRRSLRRGLLGAGVVAAFLMSPVFWLLPPREVSLGCVHVETLPAPEWELWASDEPELYYNFGAPGWFEHKNLCLSHEVDCGALRIRVQGREIPNIWL